MEGSDGVLRVTAAQDPHAVEQSAAIWARAKARRDREWQAATVAETVPGIRRRLGLDGAQLLVAHRDGSPVGFTLFAPRALTLEVFYLAVDPDAWGSGVARRLLACAADHAQDIGRDTLELCVIDDNHRAIRLYEGAGFVGTDEVERDPTSGRVERRYLRDVHQRPRQPGSSHTAAR